MSNRLCRLILTAGAAVALSCASTPKSSEPQPKPAAQEEKTPVSYNHSAAEYDAICTDQTKRIASGIAELEGVAQKDGEKTVENFLNPYNDLWMVVDRALGMASLYYNVHPNAEVRERAERCEQDLEKLVTQISMSRPIYEAVGAIDTSDADEVTQRYHKHIIRDFRRAGVAQDEPTRAKIRQLKEELVKIGQAFTKNITDDVRQIELDSAEDLAGLPQDYIDAHSPNADGKIVITTNYPDYVPFLNYAQNDSARYKLYTVFRKRGHPDNLQVLKSLLEKRYELANLLGYENWAEYITEDKMIKTPNAAAEFIEKVQHVAKPRAIQDYNLLLAELKKIDSNAQEVGDWQKSYLEESVKKDLFDFDSQQARQYFPYQKVKEGILKLTSDMFQVQIDRVDVPTWHQQVEAYEIRDDQGLVGRFFLDMHPRDNKYKHAAAFHIQSGVDGVRIPEAALVCNFAGGKDPMELMQHSQVETFLHEFGHLIHHLFGGRVKWVQQSGFNTEWDFVEAPSQMLEEWAWDANTLQRFATNDKGEAIPADLVKKMKAASEFGKGLWVTQQMFYASLSLGYYNRDPQGLDTTQKMIEMQNKYSMFDYVDDTYFHLGFNHLDGYSAIYYTYMWSLVIAKDLFSVFTENGMLNTEAAQRYRDHVLAPGGSKDAAGLVHDFLGRDYSFDPFALWLQRQ